MTLDEEILFLKEILYNAGNCYPETRTKHKIQLAFTCDNCPIRQDLPVHCNSNRALHVSKQRLNSIPQTKLFGVLL